MSKTFEYILKFNGDTKAAEEKVSGMQATFKKVAVAAGALFAADQIIQAGKAVFDYATQISALKNNIEGLTGLSGASLNKTTGAVQAIGNAFGQDVNEVMLAANTISKQFGINMEDSLEKVKQGLASSANVNGDFLNQVKEYAPQFKSAGLEAGNMITAMSNAGGKGIFDDKGADVIKEGMLRIREMTSTTSDAMKGIGVDSDKMQRDLAQGNITIFQAMQQVANKLGEFPAATAKVGTAIADIFGGPGEDAGLEYIKMLGTMDLNIDNVMATMTDAGKAQMKWAEAQQTFHTVGASVFGGTGTMIMKIKTGLLDMVNAGIKGVVSLANYFIDLYNESMLFRGVIEGIGAVVKAVFEAGKFLVVGFIDLLKNAGKLLKAVFTLDFKGVKSALDSGFGDLVNGFNAGGVKTGEAFNKAIENTLTPRKKISLITIGGAEAEAAGVTAGMAMGKGIEKGMTLSQLNLSRDNKITKLARPKTDKVTGIDPVPSLVKTSTIIVDNNLLMEGLIEKHNRYADAVASSAQSISSVFSTIGDAIGGATGSWMEFAGRVLSQIPQIISQIVALTNSQLASSMTITAGKQTEAAGSAVASAAVLPFPANIAAMIGAAASVIGLFATFKSMPKMANGGVATGLTSVIVGDYPNAMADPEVISPLSKLKGIFGGQNMQPAMVRVTGDIRLKNRDIAIALRADNNFQSRTGGIQ